jgi:glycolate oxidase FAD binding subunit
VATLVWQGLDDAAGVALLCAALGSPYEVSGAAHLPASDGIPARTCLRLENFGYAIAYRADKLARMFAASVQPVQLDDDASVALWRDIRDVAAVLGDAGHDPTLAVWRVSTAPTKGPAVMKRVAAAVAAKGFYDWGGGLVWLAVPAAAEASAAVVRGAVAAEGGHATLMRAAPELRASVPVFAPEAPALAALTRKVKASFDPDALLNPGRMWAGV